MHPGASVYRTSCGVNLAASAKSSHEERRFMTSLSAQLSRGATYITWQSLLSLPDQTGVCIQYYELAIT